MTPAVCFKSAFAEPSAVFTARSLPVMSPATVVFVPLNVTSLADIPLATEISAALSITRSPVMSISCEIVTSDALPAIVRLADSKPPAMSVPSAASTDSVPESPALTLVPSVVWNAPTDSTTTSPDASTLPVPRTSTPAVSPALYVVPPTSDESVADSVVERETLPDSAVALPATATYSPPESETSPAAALTSPARTCDEIFPVISTPVAPETTASVANELPFQPTLTLFPAPAAEMATDPPVDSTAPATLTLPCAATTTSFTAVTLPLIVV